MNESIAKNRQATSILTQSEFDAMQRNTAGYIVIQDATDCTHVDFDGASKIVFGRHCKIGSMCRLGDDCQIGDACNLGDCVKIGEKCILGNMCQFGHSNKLGYGCKLGDDCKLGGLCALDDNCTIGDRCTLGANCKIGDGCKLGAGCVLDDWCCVGSACVLGNDCTLGDRCILGDYCTLGDNCQLGGACQLGKALIYTRATFEGGQVRNGAHISISQIGITRAAATFYLDDAGRMLVRDDYGLSDADEFVERVQHAYGGNKYVDDYKDALQYAARALSRQLKSNTAE